MVFQLSTILWYILIHFCCAQNFQDEQSEELYLQNLLLNHDDKVVYKNPFEDVFSPINEPPSIDCQKCLHCESYKKQLQAFPDENKMQPMDQTDKPAFQNGKVIKKIDISLFYKRVLLTFWSILKMEDGYNLLDKEEEIVQYLSVTFSANDILTFKKAVEGNLDPHAIDSFFNKNLKLEENSLNLSLFHLMQERWRNFISNYNDADVWLQFLSILLILLWLWLVIMMIRTTHVDQKWWRILLLMTLIIFGISCIYHWRHMVKMREAKRRSYFSQINHKTVCKSEPMSWLSLWRSWLPGTSKGEECQEYHENASIEAEDEVSPLMVVAEAISSFALLPLQHIGTHSGLFFKNFFELVPFWYLLFALPVVVLMFALILLVTCGYGLHFPLGKIVPSSNRLTNNDRDCDRVKELIQKTEERLISENSKIMIEAKLMMAQISEASQKLEVQSYRDVMMSVSASALEHQLEAIMARKLRSIAAVPSLLQQKEQSRTSRKPDKQLQPDELDSATTMPIDSLEDKTNLTKQEDKLQTVDNISEFEYVFKRSVECADVPEVFSDSDFIAKVKSVFENNQNDTDYEIEVLKNIDSLITAKDEKFLNSVDKVMKT